MDQTNYIASLLAEVNLAVTDLNNDDTNNGGGARMKALEAVRKLSTALTTPEEVVLHHSFEVGLN